MSAPHLPTLVWVIIGVVILFVAYHMFFGRNK
jgi:hypothetical protein